MRRGVLSGTGSKRRLAVLVMAAMLFQAAPFSAVQAWALEKPEDIDEATWARLQDDVLEYDEISNLVEYYNPQYRQVTDGLAVNTSIMSEAIDYFRWMARDENEETRKAEKEGDLMQMIESATNAAGASMMKKSFERSKNMLENGPATKYQLRMMHKSLTSAVQQLMINYDRVLASQELGAAGVELAEAALQAVQTQRAMGMATEADVQSAQQALLSAQNQNQVLAGTITTLRQNLCLMTGWSYDAMPQIGAVPGPDLTEIDSMNPAEDITLAIGSNYTIQSLISQNAKGDVARDRKFRNMDEAKSQITTGLNELYQTVLQCRAAYDGANSAYESARLTMEGNERRHQLGMLGDLEYLQAKMAYLQQKIAAKNAALDLKTAMENYHWAVEGILDLD